jgi:hypothetical protein
MTAALTYGEIKISKTGVPVPVFIDGTAMYSLYNPARDAEAFAGGFAAEDTALRSTTTGFVIVFGLGNGTHIESLAKKYSGVKILVVEHSAENIEFLRANTRLTLPSSAVVCSIAELPHTFIASYIPALHGSVRILYQQAWKNMHEEDCAKGAAVITRAVDAAKSDYATQAHFGKIWHRNILLNIAGMNRASTCPAPLDCIPLVLGELSNRALANAPVTLPIEKEACVIAAGPSLDKSYRELEKKREDKFIIATDTAYTALLRRNITPDAVVTIDGQAISSRHFLQLHPRGGTMLFADLCCNPHIPRLFYASGGKVIFTRNGHPLAELAASYAAQNGAPQSFLPFVSSGAGTVTVTAAGIAFKSGFSRVRFFGADFSYPGNKPYAKGTYLEDTFFSAACRTNTPETQYTSLMFRGATCTLPSDNTTLTTPLLLAYKQSLDELCEVPPKNTTYLFSSKGLTGFSDWYKAALARNLALNDRTASEEKIVSDGENITPELYSCLPLYAFLQIKTGQKVHFFTAVKLAYTTLERYNIYDE